MKTYGDVDMQLNTYIEKFMAAALGVMCHHYIINQKHVLYRNKLTIYDFNNKRLWQTECPVISTRNFPCGRQESSPDSAVVRTGQIQEAWSSEGLKLLDTYSQEVINMERVFF
jgi:hypothetical protein